MRCFVFTPGLEKPPPDLVDLLVQADLYDMAFTVVLKFWRGSALKRLNFLLCFPSVTCLENYVGS